MTPLSKGRCLVCPNPPDCKHGYCTPHIFSYCHCNRVEKLPFQIIEEKFGKERAIKSDVKIKAYLDSKGYSSLSRLISGKEQV